MYTLEVYDPVAQCEGETKVSGPAHRNNTLDNVTVGLIWNGKRGGEVALRKAGELIKEKYQDVDVIFYNGTQPCEKKLMTQAIQDCDVFIGATAD